jgi:uncharacterized protein
VRVDHRLNRSRLKGEIGDLRRGLLRAEPGLGRADTQRETLSSQAGEPQQRLVARQQPLRTLGHRQIDEFLIGRIGARQPTVRRGQSGLDKAADPPGKRLDRVGVQLEPGARDHRVEFRQHGLGGDDVRTAVLDGMHQRPDARVLKDQPVEPHIGIQDQAHRVTIMRRPLHRLQVIGSSDCFMLIALSPAKTLDYASPVLPVATTRPEFAADARRLITRLREFDVQGVAELMTLSVPLAELNVGRYRSFRASPGAEHTRASILAFDGDVYDGLAARALDADALAFAHTHVRILSGLYGVLRPLDAMQPYRLEMGTRLTTDQGRNLYAYWGARPAKALKRAMKAAGTDTLVNLASEEYFGAVDVAALGARVIQPVFQERRAKGWQVVSFSAKQARGRMTRFAIDRRITQPQALQAFDLDGYAFDAGASNDTLWYFRREQPQGQNTAGKSV